MVIKQVLSFSNLYALTNCLTKTDLSITLALSESRTKCDKIIRITETSKYARRIIVSVAISLRALILKYHRVVRRWASFWCRKTTSATVLWLIKRNTCTFTSNHTPVWSLYRQLWRTNGVHICRTARWTAVTRPALWGQRYGQIEPIDQANVVKIHPSIFSYIELR